MIDRARRLFHPAAFSPSVHAEPRLSSVDGCNSGRPQTTGARILTLRRSAWIYADVPLLEQPFWDIAPIPISLTPGAEFS